jgi:hypothetical protein
MNQQPKDKPIVELLQDIHAVRDSHTPRGLVNPKRVARIAFFVSCIFIVLTTAIFIAMIWELMEPALGMRFIASMGAVILALQVFKAINEQFD